jgi:hypothetical protein
MIDFFIGVAVGTAFAPFWMAVFNNYIKPQIDKLFIKK